MITASAGATDMSFASLAARANVTLYRTFGVSATCADVPCVVVLSRASNTGPTGYDAQVSGQSVTAVVRVGDGDGMLPAAPIAGALLVVGDESWRVMEPPARTGEAGEYRLVLA